MINKMIEIYGLLNFLEILDFKYLLILIKLFIK